MNQENIKWALYGVGAILFVKYILLGLCTWDHYLHPTRTEDPNSPFLYPLMGLLGTDTGACASATATIIPDTGS